jgi:hypothetical protein
MLVGSMLEQRSSWCFSGTVMVVTWLVMATSLRLQMSMTR